MLEEFKQDAARWSMPSQVSLENELTTAKLLLLLFTHMPLRAILMWRFAGWCKQKRVPFIFGILHRSIMFFFGLEICNAARIGGGLYVPHPVGTVIQVESMGRNVSVIAGATIGMRNAYAFPRIGDNVFVGAGARILGDITIGNDAVIGANAVVIEDVPAGGTVVGVPGRLIKVYGEAVADRQQDSARA